MEDQIQNQNLVMQDQTQNQNEPEQLDISKQYPSATRVENGVAYDATGKALGPVAVSAVSAPSTAASVHKDDNFFLKLGAEPTQILQSQPSKPDDFFMKLGGSVVQTEQPRSISLWEALNKPVGGDFDANKRVYQKFNQMITDWLALHEPEKLPEWARQASIIAARAPADIIGAGVESARRTLSPLGIMTLGLGPLAKGLISEAPVLIKGGVGALEAATAGGFTVAGVQQALSKGPEGETPLESFERRVSGAGQALLGVLGTAVGLHETVKPSTDSVLNKVEKHFSNNDYKEGLNLLGKTEIPNTMKSHAATIISKGTVADAANSSWKTRVNDAMAASKQADEAREAAHAAEQAELNGTGTREQTIEAYNKASEAAKNADKAIDAMNKASENRAKAAVDALNAVKAAKRAFMAPKIVKNIATVKENFKKAFPPTSRAPYTDQDLDVALSHISDYHAQENISDAEQLHDALNRAENRIDNEIAKASAPHLNQPIATNPTLDVAAALKPADLLESGWLERGLNSIEDFNLKDMTIGEAQELITRLNDQLRGIRRKNLWDWRTAISNSPEYAAKAALVDSLRKGVAESLENLGVSDVAKARLEQKAVINVRDAIESKLSRAKQQVRGTAKTTPFREFLSNQARRAGAGVGAILGRGAGHAILGWEFGGAAGEKLGNLISPSDLTRDRIAAEAANISGDINTRLAQITTSPARPLPWESLPPPVLSVLSADDIRQLLRESSQLHADLASHYGEYVGDTSYADLEQRFLEDVANKKLHGVELDSAEKKLLSNFNNQNLADDELIRKATQKAQENAAEQTVPTATLPKNAEPLLHPDIEFHNNLDTQSALAHDIVHNIIAKMRGIPMLDEVWSHEHPEIGDNVMLAPVDWDAEFGDRQGGFDLEKAAKRIDDIADVYVAGAVANDLWHDVPFTENEHAGADIAALRKFLQDAGLSDAEASRVIAAAAERVRADLSRPGMKEFVESHASVREPGLDRSLHISKDRMNQIYKDLGLGEKNEPSNKQLAGQPERHAEKVEPTTKTGGAEAETGVQGRPTEESDQSPETSRTGEGTAETTGGPSASIAKPEQPAFSRVAELPLKHEYRAQIKRQGEEKPIIEIIPAHSSHEVFDIAREKYPDAVAIDVGEPKPPAFEDKYAVPKKKILSLPMHRIPSRIPIEIIKHELGHALVGTKEGVGLNGMLRHTYPKMGKNFIAAVDWKTEGLFEPGPHGPILKPDKVMPVIRAVMGGIAADEVFNNIPRNENHNFNSMLTRQDSDGGMALRFLKEVGYDNTSALDVINKAIDENKQFLTNKHVSDIINENAGVREEGLSEQYHYSPQRIQQMYNEIVRRQNAEQAAGPAEQNADYGRTNGEGDRERKTDVARTEAASEAANRQRTESVRPESPAFSIPKERTTGNPEHDAAIKEGGGVPAGVMRGDPQIGLPELTLFHDPQTGTTLALKTADGIDSEKVRRKLEDSRAQYAKK